MLWNDIIRTALLGTDQSVLPASVTAFLQAQGVAGADHAPAGLLAMAAVLDRQFAKAGVCAEVLSPESWPVPPEVPAEGRGGLRPFPAGVSSLAEKILEGEDDLLLHFLADRLKAGGYAFPAEYLPALLMRPDADGWMVRLFRQLDDVGQWLLRQHPEWRYFLTPPPADKGALGALSYRRAVRYLRLTDPDAARGQALRGWPDFSPAEKKEWLSQLAEGFTGEDQELLLRGLAESRKEVRQAAGAVWESMYAGMGDSAVWESRGVAMLGKAQGKLIVRFPESDVRERDQAQLAWDVMAWPGGEKAVYLGKVLSRVPPVCWERHLEWPPAVIVDRIWSSDWGNVLFPAMLKAASWFQDQAWQQLLLRRLFELEEGDAVRDHPAVPFFLQGLPPGMAVAAAHTYLADRRQLPEESSPVYRLLFREPAVWDPTLSVLLRDRLQQALGAYPGGRKCSRLDRQLLRWLGACTPPHAGAELAAGWPDAHLLSPAWRQEINRMWQTIRLHQELMDRLPVSPSVGP